MLEVLVCYVIATLLLGAMYLERNSIQSHGLRETQVIQTQREEND